MIEYFFNLFVFKTELIRLGGRSGWFVKASLLSEGFNCLSGGAGNDISFERDLIEKYGVVVDIYDPSPIGRQTCEAFTTLHGSLNYHPLGMTGHTGEMFFSEPTKDDGESFQATELEDGRRKYRFKCQTLSDILHEKKLINPCLLKIDIEGCEYAVLDDLINKHSELFPQIAVEFHHRLPGMNVWRQRFRTLFLVVRLRIVGYGLVHKSGGDFTFVKLKYI